MNCAACGDPDPIPIFETYHEGEAYYCTACGVCLAVAVERGADCGCPDFPDCGIHGGRAYLVLATERQCLDA